MSCRSSLNISTLAPLTLEVQGSLLLCMHFFSGAPRLFVTEGVWLCSSFSLWPFESARAEIWWRAICVISPQDISRLTVFICHSKHSRSELRHHFGFLDYKTKVVVRAPRHQFNHLSVICKFQYPVAWIVSCAAMGQSCMHEGDSGSIRGRTWCWGWWWMKQYCGFCQTGACFLESPESSCGDLWLVRAVRVMVMVLKAESRKSEMTRKSLFSGWVRASCSAEEMASAAQRLFFFWKRGEAGNTFYFCSWLKTRMSTAKWGDVRTRSSSPSGQRMKRAQRNRSTEDCFIVRKACKTCTWMQVFIRKVLSLCTCHVTFYDYATGSGNTGGNAKSGSLAWLLLNLSVCCFAVLRADKQLRHEKWKVGSFFKKSHKGLFTSASDSWGSRGCGKRSAEPRTLWKRVHHLACNCRQPGERQAGEYALKSRRFDFCILQKTSVAQRDGSFQPRLVVISPISLLTQF